MEAEWTYPSPKVISVFNVWETIDRNWRKPHYPRYKVLTQLVGSAFSLEQAERLVHDIVQQTHDENWPSNLHSVRITEQPIGQVYSPFECRSEYVYDCNGILLDKRPSGTRLCRPWCGRTAEEIRFKNGDLCEVLEGDEVILGIVARTPPRAEKIASYPATTRMMIDDTDDCYTVYTENRIVDDHVDSLKVFPVRFKVSERTERKLRRYFDEEETLWMRMRIASTTAQARLQMIMDELGWKADIRFPRWIEDTIGMEIKGVPGFPDGLRLELDQKKAHEHMDRVRYSFLRLAGQHPEGRGYRLKRITDYLKKPVEPETWKF